MLSKLKIIKNTAINYNKELEKPFKNIIYKLYCSNIYSYNNSKLINNTNNFIKTTNKSFISTIKQQEKDAYSKYEATAPNQDSKKNFLSNEFLSKLIGTKHYPSNKEIKLDEYTLVKCYNENDQYLGDKSLIQVFEEAEEQGKDVVLRNDKVPVPIVKIMRYKVELMKRLIKKVTKNKDIKLSDIKSEKFYTIPLNIEENDLNDKIHKIKNNLQYFSHVQIGIYCDIDNSEEVHKATNVLHHIADQVVIYGKLSKDVTIFRKKLHDMMKEIDDNIEGKKTDIFDNQNLKSSSKDNKTLENKVNEFFDNNVASNQDVKQMLHEKELQDRNIKQKDEAQKNFEEGKYNTEDNNKFNDQRDYLFIEIESLLVDTTGIDYSKMLEASNVEDIISGIKSNKFSASKIKLKDGKEKDIKINKKLTGKIKDLMSGEDNINIDNTDFSKDNYESISAEDYKKYEISEQENELQSKILTYQEKLKNISDAMSQEKDLYKKLWLSKELKKLKLEMNTNKRMLTMKAIIQKEYNRLKKEIMNNPTSI